MYAIIININYHNYKLIAQTEITIKNKCSLMVEKKLYWAMNKN